MKVSLRDWLRSGWLIEHHTSRREIADLLAVVERDLHDATAPGLSADWRLNIAYNAGRQAATAALAAAGFRAAREAHHFRVIQSLEFTIVADTTTITLLDTFRKKRNIGGYEHVGSVSDQEADEMLTLAHRIRAEVVRWLQARHPNLR
jgi:hypothetical protein